MVGEGHILAEDIILPPDLAKHTAKDGASVDANPHIHSALGVLSNNAEIDIH
jgi:hypothetical protein